MTVFLAWTSAPVPADTPGPWLELWAAGPVLTLVDSTETLSRVDHELTWALPEDTALMVAPVGARPKLKGLPPGTWSWLRARLPVPEVVS